MQISKGKRYLTRCGLIVKITEEVDDRLDLYPFVGEFSEGGVGGFNDQDFWMRNGAYLEGTSSRLDLVKEI